MKHKMDMAHDWAIARIANGNPITMAELTAWAWQYADAMQAEADKRKKAEAAQKSKEVREILNDEKTFIEREGQNFDDVEEPEVDWCVAPPSAHTWQMVEGCAVWINSHGPMGNAPSFGFTGSHIVERPQ